MELSFHDRIRARQAIKDAVRQHMFDPNVNLIDVGYRIQAGNRLVPELAVRFHLHTKLQGARFESFAEEQPERVIPPAIGGFPTDVIQSSYHLSLMTAVAQPEAVWAGDPRTRVMSPMQGGISISDAYAGGYGTLGGLVYDKTTGEEMLLSNYHVLAGSGWASPRTTIIQPGRGDGGREPVATFVRHAMNNGIDAAVARLNGSRALSHYQYMLGPLSGVAEPQLGMKVIKSGRASGITRGLVTAIEGVVKLNYRSGERLIRHVCHIVPIGNVGQVSAPVIWVVLAGMPTRARSRGLHFAGADQPGIRPSNQHEQRGSRVRCGCGNRVME
ncbi:MAG: hypothetical protein R3E39_23950 [Anaerolineae bacterium]